MAPAQSFSVCSWGSLELERDREKCGAESTGRYDGDRAVGGRNAVHLLAVIFLLVGERAEDGCQDHPGSVNPGEPLVDADGTSGRSSLDAGRPDRKIRAGEIQIGRDGTENRVHGAIGVAGVLAAGAERRDDGSDERGCRNQAKLLMDLEHAGGLVEERLLFGVSLCLLRGAAEVREGWVLAGGRGGRQVAGWRLWLRLHGQRELHGLSRVRGKRHS